MFRKISSALALTALAAASIGGSSVPAYAEDVQVSVFGPASMGQGGQACNDEVDNLVEIISGIDGYSVDRTIVDLEDDIGGQTLLQKLQASRFFFVPDMEQDFDPNSSSDFPGTAVTAFQTWLDAGGVLVMTGTASAYDIDFLNKITSWGLVNASGLSGANRSDSLVAGTPFDGADLNVSLTTPSATGSVDKGAAPSSANFKALWGTESQAAVATMTYGLGTIIYLGFDYFNSGFTEADPPVACGENGDDWVQLIIPAALNYAVQLADSVGAPEVPTAPYGGPLPTAISSATASVGDSISLAGKRLQSITRVTIDGVEAEILELTRSNCVIQLPEGLTPGLKDIVIYSGNGKLTYLRAIEVLAKETTPTPPAQKVNALAFKGFVVIYALNFEGQRLSAKIGDDWAIVDEIPSRENNLFQLTEKTLRVRDIVVRIYIDRVLIDTINLTTK